MDGLCLKTFKACEVRIHKGYNLTTSENDIALIVLSSESSNKPIGLNKEKVGPKQKGRVLGWGKTETGELATDLMQLDVEIVSNRECAARIEEGCKTCPIFDSMICADGKEGDACAGECSIVCLEPVVIFYGSKYGLHDDIQAQSALNTTTNRVADILQGEPVRLSR